LDRIAGRLKGSERLERRNIDVQNDIFSRAR
jgi:hypothetical protein